MSRLRVDPYILALLLTVAVASLFPARGAVATGFGHATTIAIGLLFFLYGARLSTREAIGGTNTGEQVVRLQPVRHGPSRLLDVTLRLPEVLECGRDRHAPEVLAPAGGRG